MKTPRKPPPPPGKGHRPHRFDKPQPARTAAPGRRDDRERPPRGDRPRSDGPRRDRSDQDRPREDRPREGRPFRDGPRPPRPWQDRPRGDRPDRAAGGERAPRPDRAERPRFPRPDRPDRPDRPHRAGGGDGARPERPRFPRPDRPDRPDRPHRAGGGDGARPERPRFPRQDRPGHDGPRRDGPPRDAARGNRSDRPRRDWSREDRPQRPDRPKWQERGARDDRAPRHGRPPHDREHRNRHDEDAGQERGPRPDHVRVCGLPSVEALFALQPERIERLFFTPAMTAEMVNDICEHLSRARLPYRRVEADELKKIAGTAMHGGIVAFATPPPLAELTADAIASLAAAGEPLLILDGVSNPQNLGAIARTAAFFACRHIVVTGHPSQAGISDASYRVAKGGLDQIALHKANDLAALMPALKAAYHVVGTVAEHGKTWLDPQSLTKPVALILGNEEHGLPRATQQACDTLLTLPGSGRVQSLNVSATAAILIHALFGASRPG